jgi:methyltransferase (TIGR00027 family)
VKTGAKQYLIFAAGLDTFAYRQPDWAKNLTIFEIDHPIMSAFKQTRIHKVIKGNIPNLFFVSADFSKEHWQEALSNSPYFRRDVISFCSLLGISYYLTKDSFIKMLQAIAGLVSKGSGIVFDYPAQDDYIDPTGNQGNKLSMMAGAAGEPMLASYSYTEMEKLLTDRSFLIRQHLTPDEITKQYFSEYNEVNLKYPMTASDNVNYCYAELN